MSKKKEKKKICKKGEIYTLDGKCVRLTHNKKTKDTELMIKKCDNPDATEMFLDIAESLAGKKGKFDVTLGEDIDE